MKTTEEMKKEYLAKGGMVCPYCGSKALDVVDYPDIAPNAAYNPVKCISCNKVWTDVYHLTDVNLWDEGS